MNHEWLTKKQAAEYLQVSVFTVHNWLKAGVLHGSQMVPRGAVRISAVSVEKLLERSKQNLQS